MFDDLMIDSLLDQMLMVKVEQVINSVDDEKQLPSLKKYCELAKKRMKVKLISNTYIDLYYSKARDRVMRNIKHKGFLCQTN